MYKHMAESIKETNEKSFISSSERSLYDSKAEPDHIHDDMYYTKDYIDNRLDVLYKSVEGTHIKSGSLVGFTKDLEILGNSKQREELLEIIPEMELGYVGVDDGKLYKSDKRKRTIDYITVLGHDNISVVNKDNKSEVLRINYVFYDKNKKFLSGGNTERLTISAPYNAKYVKFYNGTTEPDFCIKITRTYLGDIQSVGKKVGENKYQFDIVVRGNNMAKPCSLINHTLYDPQYVQDQRYASEELIKVKPNTRYQFISKNETKTKYCIWLDKDMNLISRSGNGAINSCFWTTSPKNAVYVQLYVWDDKNVLNRETEMVENEWTFIETDSGTALPTEPYESYKQTIELPVPLEGLEKYKDTLKVIDGNLIIEKRVGKLILSTTNTNWYSPEYPSSVPDKISIFEAIVYGVPCDNLPYNSPLPILSTKYVYQNYGNVCYDHTVLGIGGKNYLNELRIRCNMLYVEPLYEKKIKFIRDFFEGSTLYYPLNDTEMIDLGPVESFNLRTINGSIHILSDNTDVEPTIKCKLPNSLGSSLYSNNQAISELKNEINSISKVTKKGNTDIVVDNRIYGVSGTSGGSYLTNISMEGKTLKNVLPNHKSLSLGGSSVALIKPDANGLIKGEAVAGKNYIVHEDSKIWKGLLPNKKYTVKGFVLLTLPGGTTDGVRFFYRYMDNGVETTQLINSIDVTPTNSLVAINETFTTNETCTGKFGFYTFTKGTSTHVKCQFMVIEGDCMDKTIPYFEGLLSTSSDIRIETIGQNLLKDGNENIIHSDAWDRTYPLDVKIKDGQIVTKSTNVDNEYWCQELTLKPNTWYETNLIIKDISPGSYDIRNYWRYHKLYNMKNPSRVKFKTTNSTKYCAFIFGQLVNEEITVPEFLYITELHDERDKADKKNYKYLDYKYPENNTQMINLDDTLKSLPNGVKDTIEYVDGKLCVVRKCGMITLNGTEDWILNTENNNSNYLTYRFFYKMRDLKPRQSSLLCDSFEFKTNYIPSETAGEGVFTSFNSAFENDIGAVLYIDILKTKLSGDNPITAFKSWLSINNVNVVYEKQVPKIEPLNINLSLPLFDNSTSIVVESGPIPAILKGSLTSNLSNTLKVMMDKISVLEDQDVIMNRIKLRSTYEAYKTSFGIEIQSSYTNMSLLDIDMDIFKLLYMVISQGTHNYNRYDIEKQIDFYTIIGILDYDMADYLFNIIDNQHFTQIEE